MKKKLLSILLCLCMVVTLLPTVALAGDVTDGGIGFYYKTAEESGGFVDITMPTTDNSYTYGTCTTTGEITTAAQTKINQADLPLSGWNWAVQKHASPVNGASYTLTLNNFNLYYAGTQTTLLAKCSLNLVLVGENVIYAPTAAAALGLGLSGSLYISGDGSLDATGGDFGIATADDLTISSGIVSATSDTNSALVSKNVQKIIITGGTVTAKTSSDYSAFNIAPTLTDYANYQWNTNESTPAWNTSAYSYDTSHTYVAIKPVDYTMQFGIYNATWGGLNHVDLWNDNASGTGWSWDAKNFILTLSGLDFTTTADAAIELPANSTIVLAEGTTNTVASIPAGKEYSYGISGGGITICGNGTLNATGGAVTSSSYGIYSNGPVTISGSVTVNATGGATTGSGAGSCGISSSSVFTISGGSVTATSGAASHSSTGIAASTPTLYDPDLVITNATVVAVSGAVTDSDGYSYGAYANSGAAVSNSTVYVTGYSAAVSQFKWPTDTTVTGSVAANAEAGTLTAATWSSADYNYKVGDAVTKTLKLVSSPVTTPDIAGVTAPAAGAAPVTAITECPQYTGTVSWSDSPDTFDYNKAYTATITLTPKAGYKLAGVAANFFTVAGATSVSNAADSGVITAVFPETADAPSVTGYNVYVGGTEVTSANTSGTGWSYDRASKTLTLGGATIPTGDVDRIGRVAIYSTENLTIALNGESTLGSLSNGNYTLDYGVYAPDCTVTLKSVNGSADKLTIYDQVRGISAKDITIGSSAATDKPTLVITEDGDEGEECCLKAVGGAVTINSGALTLTSEHSNCIYGNSIAINGGSITAQSNGNEKALSVQPVLAANVTLSQSEDGKTVTVTTSTGDDGGSSPSGSYTPSLVTEIKQGGSTTADNLSRLVSGKKDLTVTGTNGAKLVFDTTALKGIDAKTTGSVTVKIEDVSKAYQDMEGKAVFSLTVTSGGKTISDFGGSVTVTLPYTLKDGEKAEDVSVWYLASDGTMTEFPCTYDAKTGLATFTVTHFSEYVVGVSEWVNPFKDVKETDWFYSAVEYANKNGLFAGTSETTFSPSAPMTRQMLWTVLGRLDGQTLTGSGVFDAAKTWATGKGITDGSNPTGQITREQLITILWRYAGSPAPTGNLDKFSDANSVANYAMQAMAWAVEKGIVGGSNGVLMPDNPANRAQVAAIVMRYAQSAAK